jgi:hypothetical protein
MPSVKLTVEMENEGQKVKKTFWLDPLTFNMNESRARKAEEDGQGNVIDMKPDGPAWLHLHGAITGAANEPQG